MAVSKEEILAQVVKTIKELSYFHINEKLDGGDPSALTLEDDLRFDELDRIEMVMELEEHFEIEIDDDRVEGFTTIGSVVDMIEKLIPLQS